MPEPTADTAPAAPRPARRRSRLLPWLLLGALLGVALTTAVVLLTTQTRQGRERVLALTMRALSDRINGQLRVQRLEGNLLSGARLYGVDLIEAAEAPFIRADSAFIEYDLRTLFSQDIVLKRLTLYSASIHVAKLPGDSLWNYQRIFQDTSRHEPGPPSQRAVIVRQARLRNAEIIARFEYKPDADFTPRQRDSAIAAVLSDTSRLMVRRTPAGLVRTYRFLLPRADVSRLFYAGDVRGGTYARVEHLTGRAWVYTDPLHIRDLRGELALREERFEFRAPTVVLPASRLSATGVVYPGDTLRYDLRFEGDQIAFRDLQWLYPRFPDEGGGAARMVLETRPGGAVLFRMHSMDMRAPGTHVRGSFTVTRDDTMRFNQVNLRADPLRMQTVEEMLPAALPVRGLRIGAAEIRGPA